MNTIMYYFFFQAEDGIRDLYVTGVQTCALPICTTLPTIRSGTCKLAPQDGQIVTLVGKSATIGEAGGRGGGTHTPRSEERRVGKEGRSRWGREHLKIKK